MADAAAQKHRVVIVGGGFGGMTCARTFRTSPVDVTILDRRNFHLFQPLLYQVATGALSPANIASPLRSIFKYQSNCRTLLGDVTAFDLTAKTLTTTEGLAVPFDTLVVATGSTHHYFGKDAQWEPLAPGLKTIEDATEIRRKVLGAFERAEREPDADARRRQLTFVVVGGGPTGVEMAGAICELARQTLKRDFRTINPSDARVILVENSERILQMFDPKLSAKGLKSLTDMGVEAWLNCRVTDVAADHVDVDKHGAKETVACETVVWAAGVKASPLGAKLKEALTVAGSAVEVDRGGRLTVATDCSVGGRADVFVIGDLAHFGTADGKQLPGLAPVAMQQGEYVAHLVDRRLRGQSPLSGFKYWDKGSMATIGRAKAVAEAGAMKLSGFMAWLAWLFIHIMYIAKFENRVLVFFQWLWNFVTRNRTARLITGEVEIAVQGRPVNRPAAASIVATP